MPVESPRSNAKKNGAGAKERPKDAPKKENAEPEADVKGQADPPTGSVIQERASVEIGFDRRKFMTESLAGSQLTVTDVYELGKGMLGEGSFGTVYKAREKRSGTIRAIKAINKSKIKKPGRFQEEIALMKTLDHPNIIRLYEHFEDTQCVYCVLQLCTGGELLDKICSEEVFTEASASIIMRQIFLSLLYMHSRGIMHRDLKPENFLFLTKAADAPLMVIDFGLAAKVQADNKHSKVGTPLFVAPEVLSGVYDAQCDMWSCGVILYMLLSGHAPFIGDTDKEVVRAVRKGTYHFPYSEWGRVSREAKQLVRALLRLDPNDRLLPQQALKHRWIMENGGVIANEVVSGDNHRVLGRFKNFRAECRLKRIALTVIASHLDPAEVQELRDIFVSLDSDENGTLTFLELYHGLKAHCRSKGKQNGEIGGLVDLTEEELMQLVQSIDSDKSGRVDYTEFLAAALDRKEHISEQAVWHAFRAFDTDHNGVITTDELEQIVHGSHPGGEAGGSSLDLRNLYGAEKIDSLMKDIDANGDGEIDFHEFLAMIKGETNSSMM